MLHISFGRGWKSSEDDGVNKDYYIYVGWLSLKTISSADFWNKNYVNTYVIGVTGGLTTAKTDSFGGVLIFYMNYVLFFSAFTEAGFLISTKIIIIIIISFREYGIELFHQLILIQIYKFL